MTIHIFSGIAKLHGLIKQLQKQKVKFTVFNDEKRNK